MKKILVLILTVFTYTSCSEKQPENLEGWWAVDIDFIERQFDEMENRRELVEEISKETFLRNIQNMAKKFTIVFTVDEMIAYYGSKERRTSYKLVSVKDNVFTIEVNGEQEKFIWEDGRIYDPKESQNGQPGIYFRQLTSNEITAKKELISKAKIAPPVTAKADERIRFLVYRASPEQAKELLKTQKDLVKIGEPGDTAIRKAVEKGDLELIKALLAHGADLNDLDNKKRNLLFDCFRSSQYNPKVFDFLLSKGLDINQVTPENKNILFEYCDWPEPREIEFVKFLISKGLDVNIKTKRKETPLIVAIEGGWIEVAELLQKHGAEFSGVSKSIRTLGMRTNLKVLKYLMDRKVIFDKKNRTGLFYAIDTIPNSNRDRKGIPELLVLFKDYINHRDVNGETALFEAHDLETVKLLINAGADKHIKNNDGESVVEKFINNKEISDYLKD